MRTDCAIYWQRTGVGDDGESLFLPPVIIKCRWDNRQQDHEVADATENVRNSGTVYPDRVLATGSFLMYGDETVLNALSEEAKAKLESQMETILLSVRLFKRQKERLSFTWMALSFTFSMPTACGNEKPSGEVS